MLFAFLVYTITRTTCVLVKSRPVKSLLHFEKVAAGSQSGRQGMYLLRGRKSPIGLKRLKCPGYAAAHPASCPATLPLNGSTVEKCNVQCAVKCQGEYECTA